MKAVFSQRVKCSLCHPTLVTSILTARPQAFGTLVATQQRTLVKYISCSLTEAVPVFAALEPLLALQHTSDVELEVERLRHLAEAQADAGVPVV